MKRFAIAALLLASLAACSPVTVGRRLTADPRSEVKVGYDAKPDVMKKLGQPYRKTVDSKGHEVWTYVWADGNGGGQKYTVAFNGADVVFLVEASE
jgi:outer membrane protein assembly factor BamE (lipoprotein component of BamABCDE complex)